MDTRTGDTYEVPMGSQPPLTEATAAKIGFRELTPQETSLVRECRKQGEEMKKLLDDARSMGADPRWVAIAQTHFQEGLMALVRSATKPAFF